MKIAGYLIKYNLIKQMRSHNFLLLLSISIFLAFLCVPGVNNGYEIFYLGGVRGIYNSEWLGSISTMLQVILLWLPCFYLLRSQISEDKRLKIDQVIAASPVSKFEYISGKFIANFSILMCASLIFTVAMMGMQFIRHESYTFSLMGYIIPFLCITIPYLLFLSSMTVFFDVCTWINGVFGNILIFFIWISLSTLSVASPGNKFDLFGLGYILNQMMSEAKDVYPNLSEGASFGYYPNDISIPTFEWGGLLIDSSFLLNRLFWICISFIIMIISAIIFNRFKERKDNNIKYIDNRNNTVSINKNNEIFLLPIKKRNSINFLFLLKSEMKLMFIGQKLWWYGIILASIVLSSFVVVDEGIKWISLIMLLPMGMWSQMGCRERYYNLTMILKSCCPWQYKWITTLFSGLLVATLMSCGILIRFALDGSWKHFVGWSIGAAFVPVFAFAIGTIVENRKMFEGLYIALFYFGPINNMGKLDFLSIQKDNSMFFLSIIMVLIIISYVIRLIKEKPINLYNKRSE